jgi:hypothetical protein
VRLVLALTAVGITLLAVGAGTASAYSGGPETAITLPEHKEQVKAYIRSTGYVPLSNTANVRTGLTQARVAASVMPAAMVSTTSVIALGATAVVIAYKIGTIAGGSEFLYEKLTGNEVYTAAAGTYLPPQTRYVTDCLFWGTVYALPSTPCILLESTGNIREIQAWGGSGYWSPSASDAPLINNHGISYGYLHADRTNGSTTHTVGSFSHVWYKGQALYQRAFSSSAMTAAEYDAFVAGGRNIKPAVSTMPATTTDAELNAALAELGANNSATGTAVQEQTIADINDHLVPPEPILMPAPELNETYTAYLTRLQELGYVGTATSTVLASELEGYGPLAPARVTIPGTAAGTVRVLDPLNWPATLPSLEPYAAVTIRYNPSTAAPAPTEGGSGGGTTTVAPEPYTPDGGLDFSPLVPDEACEKFPFGVVCWIADQLELLFLQPAEAPNISVTIPAFDAGFAVLPAITFGWDFGDAKYDGVFDTYISVVRSALAFLLWLGGLWFVGTRLLGVRGAPDTGGVD